MIPADRLALLDALATVAREAGAVIMEVYGRPDFTVRAKADASPVTEADEAAEQVILAALAQLSPGVPVVAEEEAAAGRTPDVGSGPFWLVDPLDGTKEFVARNGEFTVNIGLVEGERPVLGVVFLPALDVLYLGMTLDGTGRAWREIGGGGRESIAVARPGPAGLRVLASRSHANSEELKAFLGNRAVAALTDAGSSLKFCRVADGSADLYPRFGPTCEWDTCAAHAVLLAAGGSVRTLDGAELAYGKPGFLNPHFVASGG